MHILKIIHGYPPIYNAGSEVYSQSIVNELVKKNRVTVFSREENDYELDFKFRKERKDNIDFVYVNMARAKDGYNHPLLNKRFAKLIKKIKPDIAHIGHLNHLSIGIVDELKKLNIPILFTLHDFWLMCPRGQFLQRNFDGKNLYKLCDKQINIKCANACYKMFQSGLTAGYDEVFWTVWISKRMKRIKQIVENIDLFHAPSKYLMNRFIDDFNIPQEKIVYLDYGFPIDYLKPIIQENKGIFTFGYIGTHIPAKGINHLIKAFKKIKLPAKLKIFGRNFGASTGILKRIASESYNPIEFCGEYVNKNLATTVFNNVNAIVVPSIWSENSPLVIHEAQACKIPVITANYGGMKELVQHKINGLLYKHRNEHDLRKKLIYAIKNPDKMLNFGARGYLNRQDGNVISIKKHCNELEKLYRRLIK